MFRLFHSIVERVKAMFTLHALLDFEQQFITRQAQRKAELIREADRYQKQGLTTIANDLRRQAEELSERQPLQIVAPFLGRDFAPKPQRPVITNKQTNGQSQPTTSRPQLITVSPSRKKGK